jgi:PAS domain S-box-containing protein
MKQKILIVDDDSNNRWLLRYIVENNGHEAIVAENGLEGIEKAKTYRPDLIISDALMPVMDGFQFLRNIKSDDTLSDIPFIFYSSIYRGEKDIDLAFSLGAESYITKPKKPSEFWEEVEVVLKGIKNKKEPAKKKLIKEDEEYLRKYSSVVASKLEEKIGELEKTKAKIEESEKRYKNLFSSIRDVIIVTDLGFTIINANWPALGEIFGYELEEVLQKKIAFLFLSDEGFRDITKNSFYADDTIKGRIIESDFKRKNGEIFKGELYALKLIGDEGGTEGYIGVIRDITKRKEAEDSLHRAYTEIKELKQQLEMENIVLREEIKLAHKHEKFLGVSDATRQVLAKVEQVAGTDSTVLITGETGTGKELLANEIHRLSPRKDKVMVKVNCAALPSNLIESELFGREKGAYTGALTRQAGRFELANGSSIFLDEIGELTPDLQTKLLRAIQEGEFERLGSSKTLKVDVRVIAATNKNLEEAVRNGSFREDLYYRLNVFPIHIPPLRERTEDILPFVWEFIKEYGEKMGKWVERIPKRTIEALQRHPWSGNVRELRNVIERAMIITKGSTLVVDLPEARQLKNDNSRILSEIEKKHITEVLKMTGWRVSGKDGAAEILGLKPTTLQSRMKKLGIIRKK